MQIANKKPHNRRYFLKSAGIGLLAVTTLLWDKLVKTEKRLSAQKTVRIPFNPNKNIQFHKDFIIVNEDGQTKVFSSHCTHLGCIINKSRDGKMLCPCHGSTFNTAGIPLKGPATRSLEELNYSIDQSTNQISVEV